MVVAKTGYILAKLPIPVKKKRYAKRKQPEMFFWSWRLEESDIQTIVGCVLLFLGPSLLFVVVLADLLCKVVEQSVHRVGESLPNYSKPEPS